MEHLYCIYAETSATMSLIKINKINIFMRGEVKEMNAPLNRTYQSLIYNLLLSFLLGTEIKRPFLASEHSPRVVPSAAGRKRRIRLCAGDVWDKRIELACNQERHAFQEEKQLAVRTLIRLADISIVGRFFR